MLNLSRRKTRDRPPGRKARWRAPTRETQGGRRCGTASAVTAFTGKCGADVGAGVDNQAAVGRPRWDRASTRGRRKPGSGRLSEHGRGAGCRDRRPQRQWIGRQATQAGAPCRSRESARTCAFVPSACMTYRSAFPFCRAAECDGLAIGGDSRAAEDSSLPHPATTPCSPRWQASRCSPPCRSRRCREGSQVRAAGKSWSWWLAECDPRRTPWAGESPIRTRNRDP